MYVRAVLLRIPQDMFPYNYTNGYTEKAETLLLFHFTILDTPTHLEWINT